MDKVISATPLVSILMPVYNGATFLASALESAIVQTYSNIEIVLVNNNSGDATAVIAEEFAQRDARIKIVTNLETVPVIQNHNVAFDNVSGSSQFCKVLHADDSLEPDCVAEMVQIVLANPSVGMVGSWSLWGEELRGQIGPAEQTVFDGMDIGRRTLLGEIYPFQSPSCLMISTELLRKRGGFYLGEALHADVDNALELLKMTDFGCVQRVLTHIRDHEESVTSTQARPMKTLLASTLILLAKHRSAFLEDAEYDRRIEERLQRHYLVLARCAVEGRSEAFWELHRLAINGTGQPFSLLRLWLQVARHIVRHPRSNVRQLLSNAFRSGETGR